MYIYQDGQERKRKDRTIKNLLKTGIQIFVMSFEDSTQPSQEILDICNQLQANYNPKKTHWTMDELYKKIFDEPKLKETRLSSEHFVKDMDWIIKLGLISFHEGMLNLDEFTRNRLIQYFDEHRDSADD